MKRTDEFEQGMQDVVLISATGAAVKRFACLRQFGSIEWNGKRYVSKRMHESAMPPNIYTEDLRAMADAITITNIEEQQP